MATSWRAVLGRSEATLSMKQFIKYFTVGVFNTVFGYFIIFGCMYLLSLSPEVSNVVGYLTGLTVSYVLNRNYTFESKQKPSQEIWRFIAVFIVAYTLNFLVLILLIHQLNFHEGLSQLVAGVFYVVSSFVMNKYYAFKKR